MIIDFRGAGKIRSQRHFGGVPLVLMIGLAWGLASSQAQQQTGAQPRPAYTDDQATRGKAAYDRSCASCHGANLDDGPFAPPLKGSAFLQKHGSRGIDDLFRAINTTMPPANPGSLGAPAAAQILAFILKANAVAVGSRELPSDQAALSAMILPAATGSTASSAFVPYAASPPANKRANPLDKFTPVTEQQIAEPGVGDWLTWRRGYNDDGFSPLRQINKRNVHELRSAWTWALPVGTSESIPLVHDGVMFVYGAGDRIQALDAATGDLLWQYSRNVTQVAGLGIPAGVKRGIAIYGNRLYLGTSDVHVVALDVKTGTVVWDRQIGDTSVREGLAGGPLVAQGKVMIGTTGTLTGAKPGGPKIVGLDAKTGMIAWEFNTIAHPGEPGGDSWNGVPIDKRSGASVWTSGSYDPQLKLAYFGTGNTYDTGPVTTLLDRPGVTNDLLYTESTLALNPDTGKLAWYFQHHRNDLWDMDWAFEQQLVKLPVNGEMKTMVVTAGKMAIYDAVDAATGKYQFSVDLGLQNLVTAIDPQTGAKTVNPQLIPRDGKLKMICPAAGGAKNWIPASYNPASRTVFVPLVEGCMDMYPSPGGPGTGNVSAGYNFSARPRPDSDGNYGRVQAFNLETRKTLWTARHRAPETSGVLATAGGLVFSGSLDRYLRAYDDANGKVLWETRLNDVLSAPPMTYSVNGKQYIAIVAGRGGYQSFAYQGLVPEIKSPPDHTSSLWVFEVPER